MSTPVIGFEEDMSDTGRDYGSEAMLRRLGALAKQRREELGLGRPSFAKQAGIGSDRTVYDFETASKVPQPLTVAKLEKALHWRRGSIADLLEDDGRKASAVSMEDLDAWDTRSEASISSFSTPELLQELIVRLTALQSGMGGRVMPVPTQDMLGLAASGGHKPEHLDEDPDDDISGFNPSKN